MSNVFQEAISAAAEKLIDALETFKATKKAKKTLEKQLQFKLEENPDYLALLEEDKKLKKQRRELSESIADLKHQKELMMRELDEHEELEQSIEKTEGRYLTKKDEVLADLSRQLSEQGITTELHFKNGDLIIVVARKQ